MNSEEEKEELEENLEEEIEMCSNCECVGEKLTETQDGESLCDDCLGDLGYNKCRICNQYAKDCFHDDVYDTYVCECCFETNDMIICEDCGRIVDDIYTINSGERGEKQVCNNCSDNYYRCECCGDYYTDRYIWAYDDDISICTNCSDSYRVCDDCGQIFNEYNIRVTNCGNYYCDYCYDEYHYDEADGASLHDYSYKPEPEFNGDDMNNLFPYLGVELEIDKGNSRNDCSEALRNITSAIYCKTDGSLNRGIEIVSHPCTLNYHMNELPWEKLMDKSRHYDFTSHNAKTCGLHVHVNRDFFHSSNWDVQDFHIAKILLLINAHWENIVKFSRRNYDQLEHWAKKPEIYIERGDTDDTIVRKVKSAVRYDRYQALNLENDCTIEFRFFRGTLKINTFKAALQFVQTICMYAKAHSLMEIQMTKWEDLFKNIEYKELKDYLISKNLIEGELICV